MQSINFQKNPKSLNTFVLLFGFWAGLIKKEVDGNGRRRVYSVQGYF